jgi:hypothetical protein
LPSSRKLDENVRVSAVKISFYEIKITLIAIPVKYAFNLLDDFLLITTAYVKEMEVNFTHTHDLVSRALSI